MELAATSSPDYEYLDSGNGARLERFGPFVFNRPSPAAMWKPQRPEIWGQACGTYRRGQAGSGQWEFARKLPESWPVQWVGFTLLVKPTGFGHVGLFPEHTAHWEWVEGRIRSGPPGGARCSVLNLFAYTGAMTLVAARAGAEVCHLDAVKDTNDWARRNAEANRLTEAPVRWIADDAAKFVAREIRRGRRYDGIILDPPSYGRGPGGEKWILEEHLADLCEELLKLMTAAPRFVLFTGHTAGFSPPLMRNMLIPWLERFGGRIEEGTMVLKNPALRCALPAGFYARWSNEKSEKP